RFLLLHLSVGPLDPLSFPPRRSSDLTGVDLRRSQPFLSTRSTDVNRRPASFAQRGFAHGVYPHVLHDAGIPGAPTAMRSSTRFRSEEHTSELQSRENLVCRLLLEKK